MKVFLFSSFLGFLNLSGSFGVIDSLEPIPLNVWREKFESVWM